MYPLDLGSSRTHLCYFCQENQVIETQDRELVMLDFKSFEMVITVGFALKVKQVNLKFLLIC